MRIQHNLPSLAAFNYLYGAETKLSKTLEKLSSGYRINRAADDAAGLAVSEKMRAQITGLKQAHINSSNGISVVQTAEGALAESHAILQRMGELAVESMNGIYEPEDRQKLDDEYQQLLEELDRISESTNFNGIKLLDGSLEKKAYTQEPVNVLADRTSEILAGARTAEASLSQRNRAIESYRSTLGAGPATTIPAGGDFAITGDGVYEIADGFTGKITIAAGAKVTLTQATPTTALRNVSVQCGAGTELTIQDLNIENSDDINAIDFTGAGNKLVVEGDNKIISIAKTTDLGGGVYNYIDKSVVHVGQGTELEIDGLGKLKSSTANASAIGGPVIPGTRSAVIGGDYGEDGGNIVVKGSELNLTASGYGTGAALGGGGNGSAGIIDIRGGKVEVTASSGAGIGSGACGAGGVINISGGKVYATAVDGAGIGSGSNTALANAGTGCTINISGGDIKVYAASGAGIGGGYARDGGNIIISGGDVYARTEGPAAAIGGGASNIQGDALTPSVRLLGNGGNITITGGKVNAEAEVTSEGAAIGGGRSGDGGTIKIQGGDIKAEMTSGGWGHWGWSAAIGGGRGCFDVGARGDLNCAWRPGSGADLTISGGKVQVINGWIGGGRDWDSYDFGLNGITKWQGGALVVPAVDYEKIIPAPGFLSHFATGSPGSPFIADVDDDGSHDSTDDQAKGGLILQIGTDNEEYDKLHIYIDNMSTRGLMVAGTNILTIENAEEASDWVRYAIGRVSENRGRLGAYQNRLEHNINGLTVAEENMTAAESRLRDADIAKEMASFTMENVIAQAAQAMLAQANQKPNEVLALLK